MGIPTSFRLFTSTSWNRDQMAAKSLTVLAVVLTMAGVVMCGRLDTFKSVVFPAYVSRWPRMGEYFITKRADHLSPLVVGEVVQSRGAAVKESPTAMATSTKPSCQSLSSSTMNNPSKLDSRSPLSPGRLSPSRVPSVWSNLSRLTSRVFEMDQSEIGVVADSDILKLY